MAEKFENRILEVITLSQNLVILLLALIKLRLPHACNSGFKYALDPWNIFLSSF